ncbi:hypothetical protein [Photobacterium kishitanii]|uniref:Thioredoxin-like fold domain-containing protein n=1 Tax=Photobacterium kishitanii TaxID=318456 RepID=A0A2T3KB04_9GAMM|nr:hypothetical protein [Photobacterium kishitanii]PSU89779.1 hypothetical protein C9J27_24160 [Photobacterium kishitanii]
MVKNKDAIFSRIVSLSKYLSVGMVAATSGYFFNDVIDVVGGYFFNGVTNVAIDNSPQVNQKISTKEEASKCNISGLNKVTNKYVAPNGTVVFFGEKEDGEATYSTYLKELNILSVDGKNYYTKGCNHISISNKITNTEKKAILPVFSSIYGINFSGNADLEKAGEIAYVFLDPTCPFSRAFFKKGGIKELEDKGYSVTVIPMSRHINKDELLAYSELFCNVTASKRKAIFSSAIEEGEPIKLSISKNTSECKYWTNLKALYSLFDLFGIKGFPAAIVTDKQEPMPI